MFTLVYPIESGKDAASPGGMIIAYHYPGMSVGGRKDLARPASGFSPGLGQTFKRRI
jgi:hypothetical protein